MICVRCGKEIKDGSRFCEGCGAAQSPVPAMPPRVAGAYPPPGYAGYAGLPGMHQAPGTGSGNLKSWKKIIVISLCVVVVALLATGGVFAYLKISEPSRKLSQARSAYEDGDYVGAIDICDVIIDKWPDKSQADEAGTLRLEAFMLRGEQLMAEGGLDQYAKAEDIFDYLVEEEYPDQDGLNQDRFDLYTLWAAELKTGYDFKKAVKNYDEAATIAALSADQLFSRVECLYQQGEQLKTALDYIGAAPVYERCYNEDPAGAFSEPAYNNYIDMTVAGETGAAPPSKEATGAGQVKVDVKNTGSYAKKLFISGPTTSIVEIQPGQTTTIYITPGYYNICVKSPGENIRPFSKVDEEMTMTSGAGWYTWTLWDE